MVNLSATLSQSSGVTVHDAVVSKDDTAMSKNGSNMVATVQLDSELESKILTVYNT